eukprot:ANDGO_04971.mRNA.1 hypothetical protein
MKVARVAVYSAVFSVLWALSTAAPTVIGNYSYTYAMPLNVVYSSAGSAMVSGITLNNPRAAVAVDVNSGKVTWNVSNAGDVFVAAPKTASAPIVALYDMDYDATGLTVRLVNAIHGKTEWSYVIGKSEVEPGDQHVVFAANAPVFAVLTNVLDFGDGAYGLVRIFKTDFSNPSQTVLLANVSLPHLDNAVSMAISDDGRTVLVMSVVESAKSYVTYIRTIRDGKLVPEATVTTTATPGGAFCASPDGNRFAIGFDTFFAFQRKTGSMEFEQVWAMTEHELCTVCAYSADSITLGLGLTDDSVSSITVELWNAKQAPYAKTSAFVAKDDTGSFEDQISGLQFSDDGALVAVSSWGHASATVPTVRVLATTPTAMTVEMEGVTPGSMFGVAVAKRHDGKHVVGVVGKSVHANVMGYGGQITLFEF